MDLDAIKRRRDAATPGPWFWNSYSDIFSAICPHTSKLAPNCYPQDSDHIEGCPWKGREADDEYPVYAPGDGVPRYQHGDYKPCPTPGCGWHGECDCTPIVASVPAMSGDTSTLQGAKDAQFIAHSWQDVGDLIAEVERLRTANEALLQACTTMVRYARWPATVDALPPETLG